MMRNGRGLWFAGVRLHFVKCATATFQKEISKAPTSARQWFSTDGLPHGYAQRNGRKGATGGAAAAVYLQDVDEWSKVSCCFRAQAQNSPNALLYLPLVSGALGAQVGLMVNEQDSGQGEGFNYDFESEWHR